MSANVTIQLDVSTRGAIKNIDSVKENFEQMFRFIQQQGGVSASKFLESISKMGALSKKQIEQLRREAGSKPIQLTIDVNDKNLAAIKKRMIDTLAEVQAKTRGFNFNTLLDATHQFQRLTDAATRFNKIAGGPLASKGLDTERVSAALGELQSRLRESKKVVDDAKTSFIGFTSSLLGRNISTYAEAINQSTTAITGLKLELGDARERLNNATLALEKFSNTTGTLNQGAFYKLQDQVSAATAEVGELEAKLAILQSTPEEVRKIEASFQGLSKVAAQVGANLNLEGKIRSQTEAFVDFRAAAGQDISVKSLQSSITAYAALSREASLAEAKTLTFNKSVKEIDATAATNSLTAARGALEAFRTEMGVAIAGAFKGASGNELGKSMQALFNQAAVSGRIEDKGVESLFKKLVSAFDAAKTAATGMNEFSAAAAASVAAARGSSEGIGALSQNAHYLSVEALKAATGLESQRKHVLDLAEATRLGSGVIDILTKNIDEMIISSKRSAGELRLITKGMEQLELAERGVASLNEQLVVMDANLKEVGSSFDPGELSSKFKKIDNEIAKLTGDNRVLLGTLEALRDNEVAIHVASNIKETTNELNSQLVRVGENLSASLTKSIEKSMQSLRIDPKVAEQLKRSFDKDFAAASARGPKAVSGNIAFQTDFAAQFEDAARAGKALDDINLRIAKSGGVAKLSEAEVRAFANETSAATNASARSVEGIIKLKSQLLQNATQFGLTAEQGRAYAASLDQVASKLGNAQAPLAASKRLLENQGKLFEQARNGLDQYATQLVSATVQNSVFVASFSAIIGTVALFKDAIKSVVELQLQSARVVAVTRDVTRSNQDLADVISSELTRATVEYGVSIDQTATILREFGSAGLDAQESLAALDSTLQAVIATEGDAAELTRTIAGIFSIMGDEIDSTSGRLGKLTTINDTMVRAFKESQLELTELVQGFRFSSASARNVGVDFQELTALLELLNNNLIKSGQAGRSLQTTFSQIAQKSRAFEEAFDIQIDTSNGIDFIEIVRQISERLGEGALTASEIEKVFNLLGLEGARSFLVVTQQVEEFDRLLLDLKENAEGSAEATSNIRLDTIRGQLDILREAALEFFRVLVTPLLGSNFKSFQDIIENLSGALETVTNFLGTQVGQALSFVTTLFVGLGGVLVITKVIMLAFLEAGKLVSLAMAGQAVATGAASKALIEETAAAASAAASEKVLASAVAGTSVQQTLAAAAAAGDAAAKEAAAVATAELAAANGALRVSYLGVIAVVGVIALALWELAKRSEDTLDKFKKLSSEIRSQQIEINENISAYRGLAHALDEVAASQAFSAQTQAQYGQEIRDAIQQYGSALGVANDALNQNNEALARNVGLLQRRVEIEERSALIEQDRLEAQQEQARRALRQEIANARITEGQARIGSRFSPGRTAVNFGRQLGNLFGGGSDQIPGVPSQRQLRQALDEFETFSTNYSATFAEQLVAADISGLLSDIASDIIDNGGTVEEATNRQSQALAELGFNLQEIIELSAELSSTGGTERVALELQRLARAGTSTDAFSNYARMLAFVQSGTLSLIQATTETFDAIEYRVNEFDQRLAELQGERTFLDTGFFDAQAAVASFDTLTEEGINNFARGVELANNTVISLTSSIADYRQGLRDINSDGGTLLDVLSGVSGLSELEDRLYSFYNGELQSLLENSGVELVDVIGFSFDSSTIDMGVFNEARGDILNSFADLLEATEDQYTDARRRFEDIITGAVVPVADLSDEEAALFRDRAASIVEYVLEGLSIAEGLRSDAINRMVREFNSEVLPQLANTTFSNLSDLGVDSSAIGDLFGSILQEHPSNIDMTRFAQSIQDSIMGTTFEVPIDITPIIESAPSEDIQQILLDTLFDGQIDAGYELLAIAEAQVAVLGQQFESESERSNVILTHYNSLVLTLATQRAIATQLDAQIDAAYDLGRASINQLTNMREQNRQLGLQIANLDAVYDVEVRRAEIENLRTQIIATAGAQTEQEIQDRALLIERFNMLLQQEEQRNSLIRQRQQLNLQDNNASSQAASQVLAAIAESRQQLASFGGQSIDLLRQINVLEEDHVTQVDLLIAAQANNTDYMVLDIEYMQEIISLTQELTDRRIELSRATAEEINLLAEIVLHDSSRIDSAVRLRNAYADIIEAQTEINFLVESGLDASDRIAELNSEILGYQRDAIDAGAELNRLDNERISSLEQYVTAVQSLSSTVDSAVESSSEMLRNALSLRIDDRPFRNGTRLARDFGISIRRGLPEDLIDTIVNRIEDMPDAFHGASTEMQGLIRRFTEFTTLQEDLAERQRELLISQIEASQSVASALIDSGDYSGALSELGSTISLASQLGEVAPRATINLINELTSQVDQVRHLADSQQQNETTVINALTGDLSRTVDVSQRFIDALNSSGVGLVQFEEEVTASRDVMTELIDVFNRGTATIDTTPWDELRLTIAGVKDELLSVLDAYREMLGLQIAGSTIDVQEVHVGQQRGVRRRSGGPIGFSEGGRVGGSGAGDIIPAMLEPGEFVLPRRIATAVGPDVLEALRSGNYRALGALLRGRVPGFRRGGPVGSSVTGGFGSIGFDAFSASVDELISSITDASRDYRNLTDAVESLTNPPTGAETIGTFDQSTRMLAVRAEAEELQKLTDRLSDVTVPLRPLLDQAQQDLENILKDFNNRLGARIGASLQIGVIDNLKNSFASMFDEVRRSGGAVMSFLNIAFDQAESTANDAANATSDAADSARIDLLTALRRNEISYYEYLNRLEDLLSSSYEDQLKAQEDAITAAIEKWQGYVDTVAQVFAGVGDRIAQSASAGIETAFQNLFQTVNDGMNQVAVSFGASISDAINKAGQNADLAGLINGISAHRAGRFGRQKGDLGQDRDARRAAREAERVASRLARETRVENRRKNRDARRENGGKPSGAPSFGPQFLKGMILVSDRMNDFFKSAAKVSWDVAAFSGVAIAKGALALGGALTKFASGSQSFVDGFIQNIENLPTAIDEVIGRITTNLPVIVDALVESIPNIANSLVNGIPDVIAALVKAIPTVAGALIDAAIKIVPAIIEQLPLIVQGLLNTLTAILPKLGTLIGEIFNSFAGIIDDLLIGIIDSIPEIIDGFVKFIENFINTLPDTIMRLVAGLLNAIPDLLKSIFTKLLPSLLVGIAKLLYNFLIKLPGAIIAGIFRGIGRLFGFGRKKKKHRGGVVGDLSEIETYQQTYGTKKDEVNALLQTGEGVLSRAGMEALGGAKALDALNRGVTLSELLAKTTKGMNGLAFRGGTFTAPPTFSGTPTANRIVPAQQNFGVHAPIAVNVVIHGNADEKSAKNAADTISDEIMTKFIDAIKNKKNPELTSALKDFVNRTT